MRVREKSLRKLVRMHQRDKEAQESRRSTMTPKKAMKMFHSSKNNNNAPIVNLKIYPIMIQKLTRIMSMMNSKA